MRLSQKSIVTVVVLGCFVALSPMKAFAQEVIVTLEVLAPIIQSSPPPEVSEPKTPLVETAPTPQVAETPLLASTPVPVVVPDIVPIQTPTPITEPTPIQESKEEVTSLRSHDSDLLKDFTGIVRQAKPYYCGPAALATVFGQMGKDIDQQQIADISGMDEERGTTLYGLKQATKSFHLTPVLKKWDTETLRQYLADTDAPVIIHDIKSGEGHFTVVREITEAGIVELSDTEAGNIAVDVKTFEHAWTGYILIVTDEIDHPLLADESTDVSDAVAKTIWGTYVLVAIGDDFSDSELRNLHYCIMKAEKKSDSKKQKEAKRKCYKDAGAGIVDKSEVAVLERYGFSGLSRKQEDGTPILITSEEANDLLHAIMSGDNDLDDLRDDINGIEDSIDSKKKVLKKVDDKLDDMEDQLIRLDQDYKATKSKLKKASAKKQKELKKDLDKIEDKQDRLEAQIAAEKRRIAGEVTRLNKEIKQLESAIASKRKAITKKESSIWSTVDQLERLMGKQDTDDILTLGDKVKIAGINTVYATKKAGQSVVDFADAIVVTTVDDGKICIQNGNVHECLSTCGIAGDAVPVAGNITAMACDTTNGVVYLFEGKYTQAGLSAVAIVPYIGTVASKAGKQMVKLGSEATNALIKNAAKKIANGHAYSKHIDEFKSLGISSKEEFVEHIERVMKNPTKHKKLGEDREIYFDVDSQAVVIYDPKTGAAGGDYGTMFIPRDKETGAINALEYFNKQ